MRDATVNPNVEYVASMDMMLTLVAAGYGVGFANAARIRILNRPDIAIRPLATQTSFTRPTCYDRKTAPAPCRHIPGSIYRAFAQTDRRVMGNAPVPFR